MEESRLKFAEDEQPPAGQEAPARRMEAAAPKPGAGRPTKRRRMEIARAAGGRLQTEKPRQTSSRLVHEALPQAGEEVHRQIRRVEDDNTGVQAAHETEQGAESGMGLVVRSTRRARLNASRHTEQTAQAIRPQAPSSSNPLSRWRQKRAIRRTYMTGQAAGETARSAAQAGGAVARAKRGVKALVARSRKTYLLAGALVALLAFVMNGLSSCAPLVQSAMQSLVIAAYPAEDEDLLAAERYYANLEKELQNELNHYASYHPGFDEYRIEADDIWHDPHALMALISAHANGEWTVDDAYGYMDRLFEKQYILTEDIEEETRYRREWVTRYRRVEDEETGEVTWVPYQVEEDVPYTYRICNVTLDNFNLSHLPFYVLSREGVGRYAMYISVLGMREDLFRGSPYASTLREPGEYDIPADVMEDETFRRLMEEAEKYIGYPYVWGGDSPETSFDCSGFISYVFAASGVRDVGRLGATSLYGRCTPIAPQEARPGDLIFFEGTISGEEGITHVGLYVGGNHMLHCGSPIGYADLTDSYWQNHFYGYGRLYE